jgi:hypothetical protein
MVLLGLSSGVLLGGCGKVLPGEYRLILPGLPPLWQAILGKPRWRLEWINPAGMAERFEGPEEAIPPLALPEEWPNPVLAYPYWPEWDLSPGVLRPAGAIFPFDVESGARLRLSWEAGVEAGFYFELARAAARSTAAARSPDRFNWPRFRALLAGEDIPQQVRADPWLVDWAALAVRTVETGWDRRRVRLPETASLDLVIPHDGPWVGSSPFAAVENWDAGQSVTLEAGGNIDTYLSSGGMLRYGRGAWMWIPWPAPLFPGYF